MEMKTNEALRLAKCSLVNTDSHMEHDGNHLTEGDITVTRVCGLCGGMGSIYRLSLSLNGSTKPIHLAVKQIPSPLAYPDPSAMSFGDRRKATAYQVEADFYKNVAPKLQNRLSVPRLYHLERGQDGKSLTMCMSWVEQECCLDDCYNDMPSIHATLEWLAALHAAFWKAPENWFSQQNGLHSVGSYWHLDTRPDEHADMPRRGWEGRLKLAARAVDECLKRDVYQCLIHGDVKGANILVHSTRSHRKNSAARQGDDEEEDDNNNDTPQVTLCDYQYCGRGCPTRDLAYFFASTLDLDDKKEDDLLEFYLQKLIQQLPASEEAPTLSHLKDSLDLAYCDFCRFQSGWGYWGAPLRERVVSVLTKLDNGKDLKDEEAYDRAIRNIYW